MANPEVVAAAFDVRSSSPSSGPGTHYPLGSHDFVAGAGGDYFDAVVEQCYRARFYDTEIVLSMDGSAHKDTDDGMGFTTHTEWTWTVAIDETLSAPAELQDGSAPTTENDFITPDEITLLTDARGWMYRAELGSNSIGTIEWTYHYEDSLGTIIDLSSSEGVLLTQLFAVWAQGFSSPSAPPPVIAGNTVSPAFDFVFTISLGTPTTFDFPWDVATPGLECASSIDGAANDATVEMVMARKTLDFPITYASGVAPAADVVFDTDTFRLGFVLTPTTAFAWT